MHQNLFTLLVLISFFTLALSQSTSFFTQLLWWAPPRTTQHLLPPGSPVHTSGQVMNTWSLPIQEAVSFPSLPTPSHSPHLFQACLNLPMESRSIEVHLTIFRQWLLGTVVLLNQKDRPVSFNILSLNTNIRYHQFVGAGSGLPGSRSDLPSSLQHLRQRPTKLLSRKYRTPFLN